MKAVREVNENGSSIYLGRSQREEVNESGENKL